MSKKKITDTLAKQDDVVGCNKLNSISSWEDRPRLEWHIDKDWEKKSKSGTLSWRESLPPISLKVQSLVWLWQNKTVLYLDVRTLYGRFNQYIHFFIPFAILEHLSFNIIASTLWPECFQVGLSRNLKENLTIYFTGTVPWKAFFFHFLELSLTKKKKNPGPGKNVQTACCRLTTKIKFACFKRRKIP